MSNARAYSIYVGHIQDAFQHALQFTAGLTYEQFVEDERTVYATVRALEIVDEAAKRIPDAIRQLEPDIPWRTIAGLRDVVIHRYDEVDPVDLWAAVHGPLEEIVPQLERLQRVLEEREDNAWEHDNGSHLK